MEVTYNRSREDYVALALWHAKRTPNTYRRMNVGCWVGIPVTCAVAAALLIAVAGGWWAVLGVFLAFMGLVYAVVHPLRYWVGVERAIRARFSQLGTVGDTGRITLILTDESMVMITEDGRSETRWASMRRVVVDGDYTFVFVTDLSVAVFSRDGFVWGEDYEQARDFIVARVGRGTDPCN
jgi:hypothetical protein